MLSSYAISELNELTQRGVEEIVLLQVYVSNSRLYSTCNVVYVCTHIYSVYAPSCHKINGRLHFILVIHVQSSALRVDT